MTQQITFSFGKNWLDYLANIDKEAFAQAQLSLKNLLQNVDLTGKSFLDIGCGSGIHSLAAVEMGASSVVSIDVDPHSVSATTQVRNQLNAPHWQIYHGSILDQQFVKTLPPADVVYSWGVLHHTGQMWPAITNASTLVTPAGLLVIAIYNRHWSSNFWLTFKQLYNRAPRFLQSVMVWGTVLPRALVRLLKGKHPLKARRGMSIYYDAIDWAGGLPYEYATHDEIVQFCQKLGFSLIYSTKTSSTGCNEFVFRKN